MVDHSAQQNRRQAQFVDDAMRQARVQARKAQQTGAAVPSVKGIRESVVQPVQPAAPAVPAQSAAPLTASAPSVPRAPSTPSTLTTPKVTPTPRAASIPRVAPTAPAVNSSASGLTGLTGLSGNTGASGLLGSAGTHPQTGSYAQNANTDPLYIGRPKITNDIWGTNVPAAYSPPQTPAPAKASAPKTAQPNFTTSAAGAILKKKSSAADESYQHFILSDFVKYSDPYAYESRQQYTSAGIPQIKPKLFPQQLPHSSAPAPRQQTPLSHNAAITQTQRLMSYGDIAVNRSRPHKPLLDENGQLVLTVTDYHAPKKTSEPVRPATKQINISVSNVQHRPLNPKLQYSLDKDDQLIRTKEKTIPVFKPFLFPSTHVGKRFDSAANPTAYAEHSLYLTETEQKNIHDMCQLAGVDYYLVLATIAHESGCDPDKTSFTGAAGWMQITPNLWDAISKPSGQYYNEPATAALREAAAALGANLSDKYDKYTNLATGIAHYAKWQTYDAFGDVMSQVVNHYGEGGSLNGSPGSQKPYPILAPSTLEILYYRDLLAQAAEQDPWYIGLLYDKFGNQLTNIDPLFDKRHVTAK